jgi:hypothetical protein
MTFRTKRSPFSSGSRSLSKFYITDKSNFLMVRVLECFQLLFCLFVINALTFKLRLKAAFLRLQNRYLAFCLRKTVKRKQDTLSEYLRNRNIFRR